MAVYPERLKKLRKEKKLKQTEVAKAIGVTNDTVSLWERGIRYPENKQLRALSDLFGVSIEYLTDESYNRNEEDDIQSDAAWIEADDYFEELFEKITQLSDESQMLIREITERMLTMDTALKTAKPKNQYAVKVIRRCEVSVVIPRIKKIEPKSDLVLLVTFDGGRTGTV